MKINKDKEDIFKDMVNITLYTVYKILPQNISRMFIYGEIIK
jgi:hypothetical protein